MIKYAKCLFLFFLMQERQNLWNESSFYDTSELPSYYVHVLYNAGSSADISLWTPWSFYSVGADSKPPEQSDLIYLKHRL